jgi:hypothetical protein
MSSEGLLNEAHYYSPLLEEWFVEYSEAGVCSRSNACYAVNAYHSFIYGGITSAGLSSSFWHYDFIASKAELLEPEGAAPPILSYANCYLEDEDDDPDKPVFVIYGGFVELNTVSLIYKYFYTLRRWVTVSPQDINYSFAGAALAHSKQKLIGVGGIFMSLTGSQDIFEFDFRTNKFASIGRLPVPLYYAGYSVVGTSLYIVYGGAMLGYKLQTNVAQSTLYRIELNEDCAVCDFPCSPGTYLDATGKCKLCAPGTFNESFGSGDCVKCPQGTYNNSYGSQTKSLCIPCAEGTFANALGTTHCKACNKASLCPIGSNSEFGAAGLSGMKTVSSQPSALQNSSASALISYCLLATCLSGVLILTILVYKHNTGTFDIKKLDIFKDSHNYLQDTPMQIKTTVLGAAMSAFFLIGALCFASVSIIGYTNQQVEETKSLVPYDVLLEMAEEVRTTQFTADVDITVTAFNYLDSCSSSKLSARPDKVSYESSSTEAALESSQCAIKFACRGCRIQTGAYVDFSFAETMSYSSVVFVNVTASSSIPNEISSVSHFLSAPSTQAFRGSVASTFKYDMTASVRSPQHFTSDIIDEQSTGFHVAVNSLPEAGSAYTNVK